MGAIGLQSYCDHVVIAGNAIHEARGAGIVFAGPCNNITVTGNGIYDTIAGASGEYGISIAAACVISGGIHGNHFADLAVGIRSDGNGADFDCGINSFDGVTTEMEIGSGDSLGVDLLVYASIVADVGSVEMTSGAWNGGHLIVGGGHIWWDATNSELRAKSSAPGSESDGVVIDA